MSAADFFEVDFLGALGSTFVIVVVVVVFLIFDN
jgi:hypothetical protein